MRSDSVQSTESSFRYLDPVTADHAQVIKQLDPPYGAHPTRSGCETWAVSWAPDSSYLAWSCGQKYVHLLPWDRTKNDLVTEESGRENGLVYSHNREKHIIDCGLLVWSVAIGTGGSVHPHFSVNFHRFKFKFFDDLILATGHQGGLIKLWDCNTGHKLMDLVDHKDTVRDLHFSPDGSLILLSGSKDGVLKVWDLNDDGNMFGSMLNSMKVIYCCRWSPDCKYVAVGGSSRAVVIWKMGETRSIYKKLTGHHHEVVSVDFSPDNAVLASASFDTRVILWDYITGDNLTEFGHLQPPPRPIFAGGANDHYVRGVSFTCDGGYMSTVADDGYVRFWNINWEDDPVQIAEVKNGLCCSVSKNGAALAVGTRAGSIAILSSTHRVPSLQHLSRICIRRRISSLQVDFLMLPFKLKEYLKYRKIYMRKARLSLSA